MEILNYQVSEGQSGIRIDRYLSEMNEELSRSYIQKLLKEQKITVNGSAVKANYKVQEGDEISVAVPDIKEPDILPEDIPLDILYEDDDVLIVNKPKGMVVHPSAGHTSGTLVNAIMFHCKDNLSGINGVLRPGIVHRIDKDTTGALLVCKNDNAHRNLAEQLKEHSIRRRYRAIVAGVLKEDEGTGAIRLTAKRWLSTIKTARMLSHIIKFWNVSKMPLMWNAVWKQAERIRFVCI